MAKILVADDVEGIRKSLEVILSSAGHDVLTVENGQQALNALQNENNFDLLITDVLMPEFDGIELISELKSKDIQPKIIAVSGGGNKVTADDAVNIAGCFSDFVLRKPFQMNDLIATVDKALAR